MKATAVLAFILAVLCCASTTRGQALNWVRQLGSSAFDSGVSVSADGLGHVYITGYTDGNLSGTSAGFQDAFLTKYDGLGNLLWTKQFGTVASDFGYGVSADGLGCVYIAGNSSGSLGGSNAGSQDVFVSKYDDAGGLLWSRQFGTASFDVVNGVSADGLGNVYVSGYTEGNLGGTNSGLDDVFVSKFDENGNMKWTRQFGSSKLDRSNGVSADRLGNVFLSGATNGTLNGTNSGDFDAFVSRFDTDGNLYWTRQLGTSNFDVSDGVSADGFGNVYISGATNGSLDGPNAGEVDAFISRFDVDGNLVWKRQLGTAAEDSGSGVSTDGMGNVYITGHTFGMLGSSHPGFGDAFVSRFDAYGNLLWTDQIGTPGFEGSSDVAADSMGNLYITGNTSSGLVGSSAGFYDAFVAKWSVVPEPSSLILAVAAVMWFVACPRRR